MQNNQASPKAGQVLLVDYAGIHGDKDIELRIDAFE